ncbi:MAG: thymidylate synthase [Bordetella sp.]|nr:MAG: thymidylate synthase [Bordetella sp.]
MQQYENLMRYVYKNGILKKDRTGINTYSIFGYQMRFDLSKGFPLITTKRLHIKSIFIELLWFLRGDSNINWLKENNVHIWDEWADSSGNLGPIYGKQWRSWPTSNKNYIDQISQVLNQIRQDPNSRRLIVSAWNVSEIIDMAIPPCHVLFQFYVENGKLSCHLYQRSADIFLGLPFNIASYSLLTHIMAQQSDLLIGDFIWSGGDCHIYANHIQQVESQLSRDPYPYPSLFIKNKPKSIFEYNYKDFEIRNYQSHPHIKGQVAI